MVKSGTQYIVTSDNFYAARIGARGPAMSIGKGSRLMMLSPDSLPSYPSDDPPSRVKFAYKRKHYWHFEEPFLANCRLSS